MPNSRPGSPTEERRTEEENPQANSRQNPQQDPQQGSQTRSPRTFFGHTPKLYVCPQGHLHIIDRVNDDTLLFGTLSGDPELMLMISLAVMMKGLNLNPGDVLAAGTNAEQGPGSSSGFSNTESTEVAPTLPGQEKAKEEVSDDDEEYLTEYPSEDNDEYTSEDEEDLSRTLRF